MKKIPFLLIVCLLLSCTKQENKQMTDIEYSMLANPDSTLSLLQNYSMIGFVATICCILGLGSFIIYLKNSSKKKEQIQLRVIAQLSKEVEMQKEQIENLKDNIYKLESRNNELSKYELLSEGVRNNKIAKQIKFQDDKWNQFRMSDAYTHLQNMIREGLEKYKGSDYQKAIAAIEEEIDKLFNDYGKRLRAIFPEIKESQITFAYLVKADVKYSNIAILLNKSKASITKLSKSFSLQLNEIYPKEDFKDFLHNF